MSDTGGRDQEVGAESVAASVCEDCVFWRRVSKLAPLNRIKSQCEPEPQETSQPQLLAGPAAGDTHGFVVSWGTTMTRAGVMIPVAAQQDRSCTRSWGSIFRVSFRLMGKVVLS